MEFDKARNLLQQFKGNSYIYGYGALKQAGKASAGFGKKAVLVRGIFRGSGDAVETIVNSLSKSQIELVTQIRGSRPNSPKEDLYRISEEIKQAMPDIVISFGGGSTIDTTKAAVVLYTLNGQIEDYFGTGMVTKVILERGKSLLPHIAIQSVASSASHLTKYINITDLSTGRKKLIVDDAVIPNRAVFDYCTTFTAEANLTIDGAMDSVAHALEVLYGAIGKPFYSLAAEIADICISLVLKYLPAALDNPKSQQAKEALCLAADLGGYAIMTGGTNGGHLSSFSLVDILPHGRACAIMNPYYTVFFAPAIERPLRLIGDIYKKAGLIRTDLNTLKGRFLGIAVAEAMFEFAARIGMPARLELIDCFSDEHIERAIKAAKDPQLKIKLQNMPVPMTVEMIDEYMQPILRAAATGDLSIIKNLPV
ncbi:MAG: iron-containing alcohol dehydrogenase [Sedimentisphaerales bacterium]|nr:iron-containing alcohol dehydrogenase [Sedimentisphaerales bacterium]